MKPSLLSPLAGQFLFASAFSATIITARTQAPAIKLDPYVVSASRTPQDPNLTPSAETRVPLAELQAAQVPDLRTALVETPGVILANSGVFGGQSSVFLRGANCGQTLFIVDGVRLVRGTRSTPILRRFSPRSGRPARASTRLRTAWMELAPVRPCRVPRPSAFIPVTLSGRISC